MNLPVKRTPNTLSSTSKGKKASLPANGASASARGAFAFESIQESPKPHGQSGPYQQSGSYDPAGQNQQSEPYNASGQYQQSGPYDASGQYQQSGPYDASGQYQQSGPYDASGQYQQSGPYDASGQYQQAHIDCAMHPGRTAEAACVYCGKFFCAECLVEVNGRMYCKGDVAKVVNETRNANPQPQPQPQPFVQPINIYNDGMNHNGMNAFYPYRKRWVAALLCLLLGYLGVHRFYVGKIGTGLLYLFTFGFGGLGVLLDLIIIICGGFRDKQYMPLV